jgi:hypothetical protein
MTYIDVSVTLNILKFSEPVVVNLPIDFEDYFIIAFDE